MAQKENIDGSKTLEYSLTKQKPPKDFTKYTSLTNIDDYRHSFTSKLPEVYDSLARDNLSSNSFFDVRKNASFIIFYNI